ncbi:MAG: DNA-3-methyladenine glycosylase 2 family protein [Crenarchaeota archaeon]|nr:DNA-3-methyladenine glycosylase 2 family protein [Thermoproteota archaeon]
MQGQAVFRLRPSPPYTVTPHLESFTLPGRPTPCIYNPSTRTCRRLVRRWRGGHAPVAYSVRVAGEGWSPLLEVSVYMGSLEDARRLVEHIYNTAYRYPDVGLLAEACPGLRPLLDKAPGLRPLLAPSLWEALLRAIVSQQVPLRLANRFMACLVESLGGRVVVGGVSFYDVPLPGEVLGAGAEALRRCGLSRRKAEYITGLAGIVLGGYDLEGVADMEPWEAVRELCRIRGVGPWTAKLAYMAATGRLDILLGEDRSVSRGLVLAGCRLPLPEGLRGVEGLISYLAASLYESSRGARGAGRRSSPASLSPSPS